jgi:hypothetical protein
MSSPTRRHLVLAAGFAGASRRAAAGPAAQATRSRDSARIWVIGGRHPTAPAMPRIRIDGADAAPPLPGAATEESVPPGVHIVWTADPGAGHCSLVIAPGAEAVLRLTATGDKAGAWRLDALDPVEARVALTAALLDQRAC